MAEGRERHHQPEPPNEEHFLNFSAGQLITICIVVLGIIGGLAVGRMEHMSSDQEKVAVVVAIHDKDISALKEQYKALCGTLEDIKGVTEAIRKDQVDMYKHLRK